MKKLSLQWRLTIITTLFIALICGCLTMFIYQNGVYYMDDLQNTVEGSTDKNSNNLYISIPDDVWDDFADNFSIQVNNNKTDYRNKSLLISSVGVPSNHFQIFPIKLKKYRRRIYLIQELKKTKSKNSTNSVFPITRC